MSEKYLAKAFEIIEKNPFSDAYFVGSTSEELIIKVEKVLGLKLPINFIEFIKKYGAGNALGNEFYGVTDDNFHNSSIPNFVWITLQSRKEDSLPNKFIIIAESLDGNYIVLNCSDCNKERNLVSEWVPSIPIEMQKLSIIAESYAQFLFETLQESLL